MKIILRRRLGIVWVLALSVVCALLFEPILLILPLAAAALAGALEVLNALLRDVSIGTGAVCMHDGAEQGTAAI